MKICAEFFGAVRLRTETAKKQFEFDEPTIPLSDVLTALTNEYPRLTPDCISEGNLQPAFAINLNGERFVRDLSVRLCDGDSILLMSADAGG